LGSFCRFGCSPDEGAERRNPGTAAPHSAALHAGYKPSRDIELIGHSRLASFCLFARREHRRVERADGADAAREGAALVAVEARKPHVRAGVARIGVERGEQRQLGAAHPREIDHRLGDAAGEGVARRIGCAAGLGCLDAAGERDDVVRERGLVEHRHGEAVPARVARRDRLAGTRLRAGRALSIAPVGADLGGAGHLGPPRRMRTPATISSRGAVARMLLRVA
jgi:hypothetical protein